MLVFTHDSNYFPPKNLYLFREDEPRLLHQRQLLGTWRELAHQPGDVVPLVLLLKDGFNTKMK